MASSSLCERQRLKFLRCFTQVTICRRALPTLLGMESLLVLLAGPTATSPTQSASPSSPFRIPSIAALLDVTSSILHNLAIHPRNRTQLFKAELRGATGIETEYTATFAALEGKSASTIDKHLQRSLLPESVKEAVKAELLGESGR